MLSKELLKEVKKIEIKTKSLVDSVYSGAYKSVFKGRGIEFAGIRNYIRGDEFRSIDWKVTARTGKFHVREHVEERELSVMVAVDLSGSMAFGSQKREKRETAVEFAAAIGMAATRNNDRVGVCLFTDHLEKVISPEKGMTHMLRLIRELLYFIPEGRLSDLRPALDFLNRSIRTHSVVFLVTDGLDLPPIERELSITASRHDLIFVSLRDKRESEVPNIGLIEIEDPETNEETTWDTSSSFFTNKLFEEETARRRLITEMCNRLGIDQIDLIAGESVVNPICRLFATRERRQRIG